MHPDYLATRYAKSLEISLIPVQHHHAHIASGMAEHGISSSVIGVALDGSGFGPDRTVWGGEFLVADLKEFTRAAHLKQYPLPGGEEAVRNPERMVLNVFHSEFTADFSPLCEKFLPGISLKERNGLESMIRQGFNSPLTSSAGRLFDVVACLCGLGAEVTYEGRAAIRLQAVADEKTELRVINLS